MKQNTQAMVNLEQAAAQYAKAQAKAEAASALLWDFMADFKERTGLRGLEYELADAGQLGAYLALENATEDARQDEAVAAAALKAAAVALYNL